MDLYVSSREIEQDPLSRLFGVWNPLLLPCHWALIENNISGNWQNIGTQSSKPKTIKKGLLTHYCHTEK